MGTNLYLHGPNDGPPASGFLPFIVNFPDSGPTGYIVRLTVRKTYNISDSQDVGIFAREVSAELRPLPNPLSSGHRSFRFGSARFERKGNAQRGGKGRKLISFYSQAARIYSTRLNPRYGG